MERVLVCGGSGILGREMCKLLQERNIPYIGTYFTRSFENGIKIDINNPSVIFETYRPTVCINCIVERTVDTCENNWSNTKKVNIDFVDVLAKLCNTYGTHMIHISTDYVFDGQEPPYTKESRPNPLQNYGISKLISEYRVHKNQFYTIVRTPVLYSVAPLHESAVTLIGKKVLDQTTITTEDDELPRHPVFIPDVCVFLLKIMTEKMFGIYHFSNSEPAVTKYQILQMISSFLNKTTRHVSRSFAGHSASRPYDTRLEGEYSTTKLKDGLKLCFEHLWHPPLGVGKVNDVFLLIDLDGTLVNSEEAHYQSYKKFLPQLTREDFEHGTNDMKSVRHLKQVELATKEIQFIHGADQFIEWIYTFDIPHAVVTNTTKDTVDLFKQKLPLLSKIKNWVTREQYTCSKPDAEPYVTALKLFSNNEKYIVGIENTLRGYESLKNVTRCIYMMNKKIDADVYTVNSFTSIMTPDTFRNDNF